MATPGRGNPEWPECKPTAYLVTTQPLMKGRSTHDRCVATKKKQTPMTQTAATTTRASPAVFISYPYAAKGDDLPLISSKNDLRAASFLEMAVIVSASCGKLFRYLMCCLTMFITNQSVLVLIQIMLSITTL